MPEPTREQLERLDAAVAALPDGLDPSRADALVNAALGAAPARRSRPVLVFAAGVVLGAVVAGAGLLLPASPRAVALGGEVMVDGRRPAVRTGPTGSAVVVGANGTLLVPRNSALEGDVLLEGALLVHGFGLEVKAGSTSIRVDGKAFVSMEPGGGLPRVTPSEDEMKTAWMMLGPALAGAVTGAVVTVFVVEGHATASTFQAGPVTVKAGETWNAKDGKVVAVAAAAPLPAEAPREADVAGLSREQLVARIEVLRNEKEQLLREKAVLKKSLDDRGGARETSNDRGSTGRTGDRNYFVLTPEELKASAAKGELRLRIPLGDAPQFKVEDKAAAAVGISADERRAIDDLFVASKQRMLVRLRQLYREIGGSEQVAFELSDDSLLREIRAQSLKDDFTNAIRQLANERAGLVPKMSPNEGPAVLRAFRQALDEDDRFVTDVTAVLGPQRAEALLNHPESSHADNVFGVGAPKKDVRAP